MQESDAKLFRHCGPIVCLSDGMEEGGQEVGGARKWGALEEHWS